MICIATVICWITPRVVTVKFLLISGRKTSVFKQLLNFLVLVFVIFVFQTYHHGKLDERGNCDKEWMDAMQASRLGPKTASLLEKLSVHAHSKLGGLFLPFL